MKYIYQNFLTFHVFKVLNLLGIPLILIQAREIHGEIDFHRFFFSCLIPSMFMLFIHFLCDFLAFNKLIFRIRTMKSESDDYLSINKHYDGDQKLLYFITSPRRIARTLKVDPLTAMIFIRHSHERIILHRKSPNQFFNTYKIEDRE